MKNKPVVNKAKLSSKRLQNMTVMVTVGTTRNNTIITIADSRGGALCASSGGVSEKGARKRTAHAAKEAGKDAGKKFLAKLNSNKQNPKIIEASVKIKGNGSGRESAVLGFAEALGKILKITKIEDVTTKAHGGCRKEKPKRN
jgi:ribosomal protein S11